MLASLLRAAAVVLPVALATIAVRPAGADGPKDNLPDNVRPIPPKGSELPPADAAEIRKGLAELQRLIKAAGRHELLPDVQIYEKAVRWALDYCEIYDGKGKNVRPGGNVRKVLAAGLERAKQLADGQTPWTKQTGPVLRGYRSKIDGSVQPYWLTVPDEYDFTGRGRYRLDCWWHGRGETLSEANFMASPPNASGIIPARGMFILQPYGRYCNANKFAGEVDTLECLHDAKRHYSFYDRQIVARGFSMGGAACWQFAVHYPTLWCAAAPGAGFSETADFLKVFQNEPVNPPWYEQKLWHLYDATDYAANLFNVPTVAYSGEIDRQKQAADMMEKALKKEGIELVHIIGPGTAHAYERTAKEEVNRRIDLLVDNYYRRSSDDISFTTWTLRYNRCRWAVVEGLERHWERARVAGSFSEYNGINVNTSGVTRITLHQDPGKILPAARSWQQPIVIDGQKLPMPEPRSDWSFHYTLEKVGGKWREAKPDEPGTLAKRPGLQGPIDDAFMDSFVMVKPSGQAMNEKIGDWAAKEMKHATDHWRSQFRGDAPAKADTEITDADIKNSNLILWGDPSSNAVLAKIADKLPVKWTAKGVQIGDKTYDAATHVPVLIYPNPLNPKKYVVINSGFTYREYDYLNNARQVPKLPDYAVVDITTPPNSRYPGKIVRAGFFGEKWEMLPDDGK
jgi:dienelactone hydrolase